MTSFRPASMVEFLEQQPDFRTITNLAVKDHIELIEYFLCRTGEFHADYFKQKPVVLVMQSFIAKLRESVETAPQFHALLKKIQEEAVLSALAALSPPTVLNALFTRLVKSAKKNPASINVLNKYPLIFGNLILSATRSGVEMSLAAIVTNRVTLRFLARKFDSEQFLRYFNVPDEEISNRIERCNKDLTPKNAIFMMVAEDLVQAAVRRNTLDYLMEYSPSELASILPETITALCEKYEQLPTCMVPPVAAIALRFNTSVLNRVKDPFALLQIVKHLLKEAPDEADSVASLVVKRPELWEVFSEYLCDLPSLAEALRTRAAFIFTAEPEAAPLFIQAIPMTETTAIECINLFRGYLPNHMNVFSKLARTSPMAFSIAQTLATTCGCWTDFCSMFREESGFISSLLNHVGNYFACKDITSALDSLWTIIDTVMGDSAEIKQEISAFILRTFGELGTRKVSEMQTLIKILATVHPWSNSVIPLVREIIDRVPHRLLDTIIRILSNSWNDSDHRYVVFRLRMLFHACETENLPKFWSDEMMMINRE